MRELADKHCPTCHGSGWSLKLGGSFITVGGHQTDRGVVRCECWLAARAALVSPMISTASTAHAQRKPVQAALANRDFHTHDEWISRLQGQEWKCFWCSDRLTFHTAQKDHVQPRSRGGSDKIENVWAVCAHCNDLKGNMNGEEFIAARPGLVGQKFTACAEKSTGVFDFKGVVPEEIKKPSWAWKNPTTKRDTA